MRSLVRAHGELLFVFAVGVAAQAETWLDPTWSESRRPLALVAVAMTAALLLRIRRPLLALVLVLALLQVATRVHTVEGNDPMTAVIVTMVASYSAGAHARGRGIAGAVALLATATGTTMVDDGESLNISGFLFFGFFFFAPFLAGLAIRARRERERLLVSERDERARLAVAEERSRIARELHDVVAHAIGVIVLQARGARRSLEAEPADARAALDAIESTAAGALAEMRRLLDVLRGDDEHVALAPQPSLAQVERLARQVREAGLPVDVIVTGAARELPAGVDLSAYRIVQEALTNALKHAGPARARVLVHYGDDHVALEIADDGAGAGNGDGGRHGLVGMRERAAVYGGELESGPRDGGGYAVRARLPL